jgi:hypothetical protein
MALTCLQIIQTVCKRIGITAPTIAVNSVDQQIVQILALSEEEGQEHSGRYPWQALQVETSFTTVATEIQGALSTIAPGFEYIVNDTIWNRTLRRPVYGPKAESDWQQAKAMNINGPFNSYRLKGDNIIFNPIPAAGQSCYFEYISDNWINTFAGGTASVWSNDADTPKLDDMLIVCGTIWRWKQAKGLDYSEDFAKYERQMQDAKARDGGKPTLSMGGTQYDIKPGIFIPAGSW